MKIKKKPLIIASISALVLIAGIICTLIFSGLGREILSKIPSSDTFNKRKYISPDYNVDGKLNESIWKKAPCVKFGDVDKNDDEVEFRYYYGKRGITASFVVKDSSICYADNAINNSEIFTLSDAVFLSFDVKNDGGTELREDDIKVCVSADGRMAVAKGSGGWVYSNDTIDYQVVVDGKLNKSDGKKDVSWTVELFLPYETYGIDKDGIMGMMLEWDDSHSPAGRAVRHIWNGRTNAYTVMPEYFNPMDKNGLAFTAPDGWVPSMGRFVSDDKNQLVVEDVRALAYYTKEKMNNGCGTLEATVDASKADKLFSVSNFSGLLLGVKDVGETEKAGWETKDQYGIFISNSEKNPQLVVATIRMVDGKAKYTQLASGDIVNALPNFAKDKVCTVKVAKNGGWMEIYLKDSNGKYQHLLDVYDVDPLDGDYIGVRAAVAGFAVRDIKISSDCPKPVNPYSGKGFTAYSGLVQKTGEGKFVARTAGTTATFGSLVNKYGTTNLKTLQTSLTLPERPSKPEDKIKGILLNYNDDDKSYLVLDYRHGESKGKEWDEDYRFYIRQRTPTGWGGVAYVGPADGNTTYDFRITPIENKKGATEFLIEYKKSTEQIWSSTYCKNDDFVMSGTEYGIQTSVGNQQFGEFQVKNLGYQALDEKIYDTVSGRFIGINGGGIKAISTGNNLVIDKSINLKGKSSYSIKSSYNIVQDKNNTIKGIVFNYDPSTGGYLILDYRYVKDAYRLYVRQFDGKKWGATQPLDVVLDVDAVYNFNINVSNGKNSVAFVIEYQKNGGVVQTCGKSFDFAMSGRNVGFNVSKANGMQFGKLSVGENSYIGIDDSRYDVVSGAFKKQSNVIVSAMKQSILVDKTINNKSNALYSFIGSFRIIPDKTDSIKGIIFNYDASNGSYLVLDYRYVKDAYRLYVRQFDGKSWGVTVPCNVILTENAIYNFAVDVVNQSEKTTVHIDYNDGTKDGKRIDINLDFAMTGRKVGYQTSANNNMQFGLLSNVVSSEIGIVWPDDWAGALGGKK